MAKAKPAARTRYEVSKPFMVMQGTSYPGGGFPGFLNDLMAELQQTLDRRGAIGPVFKWTFSGGDGIVSPIILTCNEV